jgi:hypothetical protein
MKRTLAAMIIAVLLLVVLPLTVNAAAAITSFHMDRTTVPAGQSITLTVHTSEETTFVFAEIGGTRTQGTQTSQNTTTGVRTWNITLNPTATATRVDVFANTANTNIGTGVVSLSIPITVTGGGTTTQQPGTSHGPLAIVSITEIQAMVANTVRLEIVTGLEAGEVWVTQNNGSRFTRGIRVSSSATTQTWHIVLSSITPWQQTVQVSANVGYYTRGATNQNYTLRHSASFVPQVTPIIFTATANPVQINLGASTTISVQTNTDVNHVWMIVDGVRRNATRIGAATGVFQNWTATVSPNSSGSIVVHANATDTATGAATRNVHVDVAQTQVSITHASASWHPNSTNPTHVRVVVHTNIHATDVWVDVGNRIGLRMDRSNRTQSGQTWIWQQDFEFTTTASHGFSNVEPIHIRASDIGNLFTGTGHEVSMTLSGVGGFPINLPGQGSQNQGIIRNTSLNPFHVSRENLWSVDLSFTTDSDVTAVRVRDAAWNSVAAPTSQFTEGLNNTREWTLRNLRPIVPANAGTTMILIVEVQRGTQAWVAAPAVSIPIWQ